MAAEPGPRPNAGQPLAPGTGLDARYEQLSHAALHVRVEAFAHGLVVLPRKGVTAGCSPSPTSPTRPLPPPVNNPHPVTSQPGPAGEMRRSVR